MKLTSEEGAERAAQLEVARRIALDQLAVRQRSEQELRAVMLRRNVPAEVAEEVLARFVEVGLIDDAAFALAVTESRSTHGQRGRARIRQELQAKGVERDVAEAAIAQLDPEAEYDAALNLAQRRLRSMAGLDKQVARRRLAGVLARRGFPGSVVSSVLAEVFQVDPVEFSTGEQ